MPASAPGTGPADLGAAWCAIGPRAAGAIPIRASRNGVVTLACADAMRAQQIRADADYLQAELSRIAGVSITRIDTVIADHALKLPEFDRTLPVPVSPAALKAAEQAAEGMTAGIDDAELRDAITRAAAAAIARSWDQQGSANP